MINQDLKSKYEQIKRIDNIRDIAIYLMNKFKIDDYSATSEMASKIISMGYTVKNVQKGIYDEQINENIVKEFYNKKNYIEVDLKSLSIFKESKSKQEEKGKQLVKTMKEM